MLLGVYFHFSAQKYYFFLEYTNTFVFCILRFAITLVFHLSST